MGTVPARRNPAQGRNDGCGRLTSIFVPTTVVGAGTTVGFPGFPRRAGRAGFKPAPTGGNGCPPATSPTGGRTRGSAPTAGHARIPLIASLTRTAPVGAGFKPAPTGGNGCPPATSPTGGRTRGSAPTAGHARIPLTPSLSHPSQGERGSDVSCLVVLSGLGFTRERASGLVLRSRWVRHRGLARASAV